MTLTFPAYAQLVSAYGNTAAHNDALHRQLTQATWADPVLAGHRRHIEEHQLGFGDAAFHAMWAALLQEAGRSFGAVRALEIGIYKGQIISLWSLLGRELGIDIKISALGPLAGQPAPPQNWLNKLRYRLSPRYREQVNNANFYADENYEDIVRRLFQHFHLNFEAVQLHRGFSTDPLLLNALAAEQYHLVYVDGDHTFDGALHDFRTFGSKVVTGGWLVADDAGGDLPGTVFWKGHEAVTRAAQALPSLGFKNVLNVGHNRVYQRIAS